MRFPPQELAGVILKRSRASVRVGAVIWDRWGIFAWGWNHEQDGKGLCAERHAILRANPRRLKNAIISVEGRRKKSGKLVFAKPCAYCEGFAHDWGIKIIEYRTKSGEWERMFL